MFTERFIVRSLVLAAFAQFWTVRSASACAVCFSDDGRGLSAGLNAGIAVLLGLALLVQLVVGRFLWKVAKRSRLERDRAGVSPATLPKTTTATMAPMAERPEVVR